MTGSFPSLLPRCSVSPHVVYRLADPFRRQSSVRVYHEFKTRYFLPLTELMRMTPAQAQSIFAAHSQHSSTGHDQPATFTQAPDEALQTQVLPPVSATVGLNFDGLGLGFSGFGICCDPARHQWRRRCDSVCAVGQSQLRGLQQDDRRAGCGPNCR